MIRSRSFCGAYMGMYWAANTSDLITSALASWRPDQVYHNLLCSLYRLVLSSPQKHRHNVEFEIVSGR